MVTPFATEVFKLNPPEYRNYVDLVFRCWPTLEWRHAGFGAMQAYIREGADRELRVHIWHHTLVKMGIRTSGLCHDHRFDMRSCVLYGRMIQTEFTVTKDPNGDFETHRVLHARAAMAQGGSFHHDPTPTGDRYRRRPHINIVDAGSGYTFKKFAFHETESRGLAITLCAKSNQEDVNARILAPVGIPIIHAFTDTKSQEDVQTLLDLAWGALGSVTA